MEDINLVTKEFWHPFYNASIWFQINNKPLYKGHNGALAFSIVGDKHMHALYSKNNALMGHDNT